MLLTRAQEIMKEVREHFAEGGKSGNKAYAASADVTKDPDGKLLDGTLPKFDESAAFVAKGTAKRDPARRNHNVVISMTNIIKLRSDGEDNSAVDYGKRILEGGHHYGNCTEMACVAAYLVSTEDSVVDITMAITGGAGDHVFCVVGEAAGWEKVRSVPDEALDSIVIDPWANVCCTAGPYAAAFASKMGEWLGQGKRISGGYNLWLAPDAKYLGKFYSSPLDLLNARNSSALREG